MFRNLLSGEKNRLLGERMIVGSIRLLTNKLVTEFIVNIIVIYFIGGSPGDISEEPVT